MVRRRVNHCDPVIPSRQASSDNGRQNAIHRAVVQRFKLHKALRVRRSRLVEPRQCLDHDVGMPYDVPAHIDFLGARHISLLRIREPTGFEMCDRDLDGDVLVFREGGKVVRGNELGRGHVVDTWNYAYWCGIT